MAELAKNPTGIEFEDWVSAHFAARGCYVEASVKERCPDEILELDAIWTDYRQDPEQKRPVEVKSGNWGMNEVFKFYGWTRYLGLEPGQFVHKLPCEHDPAALEHVQKGTKISFIHAADIDHADEKFKMLGLPDPASPFLSKLWRYSFWARRRLGKSLGLAIEVKLCPESAKAAKDYLKLINDAVFFIPDIQDRIEKLISAHFGHQKLGKSVAYEIETKNIVFENPPSCDTFNESLYEAKHIPVQACFYAEHRARLYILKALVDYWLAKKRGQIQDKKKWSVTMGGKEIASKAVGITAAMEEGLAKLSAAKTFRLFPVLWQTFLWSWGGFLLKAKIEEEYVQLEKETGVPAGEIPLALSAFDLLFPVKNGWFRDFPTDRRVLILMPAPMRGIGAYRRKLAQDGEEYDEMEVEGATKKELGKDNNAAVRLLEAQEEELVQ